MTILKISLIFILVLFTFHFLTKKYLNPYKLLFVFGKKGSGKSTLLTKLTERYRKWGWYVFSTEANTEKGKYPTFDVEYEKGEVYYIEPTRIFEYNFPPRSCVFIDEVSLIWDNRDFKTMDKRVVEWFRYQRHHKVRVYFFSQTFDIDKKLRDLADDMYLVNKHFRVFAVASHIVRKPVVVHPSAEAPARIDEDMIVDGPLLALFGGKIFAFIPYWAKKFDSHKTDYKNKGL